MQYPNNQLITEIKEIENKEHHCKKGKQEGGRYQATACGWFVGRNKATAHIM